MRGISIIIDGASTILANLDEGQLNQLINDRRDAGIPICIEVRIFSGDVHILLKTSDCEIMGVGGGRGGSGRPLTSNESGIFNLWNSKGLNSPNFNFGDLISFLNIVK